MHMHDSVICIFAQNRLFAINSSKQILTDPDKILQAELKSQSHVLKFWSPGPKGCKMAVKTLVVFVTSTDSELAFFVTGQIGMKFGKNRQSMYYIEP